MDSNFSNEFMRGQQDCKDGVPHKADQPEAYDRGYATEYESEQAASQLSDWGL